MLIRFITTLLVCENEYNGDELHRGKSMLVADEKLIINELGPNIVLRSIMQEHNTILHQLGALTWNGKVILIDINLSTRSSITGLPTVLRDMVASVPCRPCHWTEIGA